MEEKCGHNLADYVHRLQLTVPRIRVSPECSGLPYPIIHDPLELERTLSTLYRYVVNQIAGKKGFLSLSDHGSRLP